MLRAPHRMWLRISEWIWILFHRRRKPPRMFRAPHRIWSGQSERIYTDNRSCPPRRPTPAMVSFPLLVISSSPCRSSPLNYGRCCDAASLLPTANAYDVAVVANEPSLHCMYDFWQQRRPPCCYCAITLPFQHHRFLLLLLLMAMKMIVLLESSKAVPSTFFLLVDMNSRQYSDTQLGRSETCAITSFSSSSTWIPHNTEQQTTGSDSSSTRGM